MRAHLLLINLPPRRKIAPPPSGRHLLRQLGGRQWGDGVYAYMYTWVHMQCIHTDCYLYTANNTSEPKKLVQYWLNVAPLPALDQCLINHVCLDVDVKLD